MLSVRPSIRLWAPIISGPGKVTHFKFCIHIYRLNQNKSPLKIFLGKVATGVVRDSRKISGHPYIGPSRSHLCDSSAFLLHFLYQRKQACILYRGVTQITTLFCVSILLDKTKSHINHRAWAIKKRATLFWTVTTNTIMDFTLLVTMDTGMTINIHYKMHKFKQRNKVQLLLEKCRASLLYLGLYYSLSKPFRCHIY